MNLKWKRRTVKIKASFYVSLPVIWAEANNVHQYGSVSIEMLEDGALKITPAQEGQK